MVFKVLNVVHDLLERERKFRFVLTGSSARKLRRGGVDLLAGRAVVRTLHPFMAAEYPPFELAVALRSGLLPLVVTATDPQDVLSAYASLYLEQEVQLEGWARDVGHFAPFLEAMSFSHAQFLEPRERGPRMRGRKENRIELRRSVGRYATQLPTAP